MNNKVRIILSIVLAVAALVCGVFALSSFFKNQPAPTTSESSEVSAVSDANLDQSDISAITTTTTDVSFIESSDEESQEPESTIDNGNSQVTVKTKQNGNQTNKTTAKQTPKTTAKKTTQPKPSGSTFTVRMDNVSCKKGDRISVPVTITKNPGIWGFQIDLSYDTKALKYVSGQLGPAFNGQFGPMISANTIQMTGNSITSNVTGTGLVATLTFDVLKSGSFPIKVSTPGPGFNINVEANNVPTSFSGCTVKAS